jgi:hypothetical protein
MGDLVYHSGWPPLRFKAHDACNDAYHVGH